MKKYCSSCPKEVEGRLDEDEDDLSGAEGTILWKYILLDTAPATLPASTPPTGVKIT